MAKSALLITGATGNQGGAAIQGKVGFDADLPALRQMSPDLTTLEQWAAHGSA